MDVVSRTQVSLPRATVGLRTVGDGATAVLFVHGWMTSGAVFDDVIPLLEPAGRRFLLLDQRGAAGATATTGGYAIADYVTDLRDTLDALAIERAVVVGHSMGGQLALALAALHPERVAAVCAITPVPLSGFPLPAGVDATFAAAATDPGARRQVLQMTTLQLTPAGLDRLVDLAAGVDPACMAAALTAWTGGIDVDPRVITAPVTVIATDDPVLTPSLLQRAVVDTIPGAQLRVLPGPGHYPQVEAPAALAQVLNDVLAGR